VDQHATARAWRRPIVVVVIVVVVLVKVMKVMNAMLLLVLEAVAPAPLLIEFAPQLVI